MEMTKLSCEKFHRRAGDYVMNETKSFDIKSKSSIFYLSQLFLVQAFLPVITTIMATIAIYQWQL